MRAMVLPLPHFRAHSACSSAMLRWVCGLLGGVLLGISLGGLLLPPVWAQQAPPAQQGISPADAMPVSALTPRWPIPGLAAGWVPQGLAFDHSGWMYLSSYRTASDAGNHSAAGAEVAASGGVGSAAAAASPTCRVTWLDPATGQARGHLDWPAGTCRHAGGLAWSPAGAQGSDGLWMADTTTLWRIDLPRTHATGPVIGARRAWQLCGALRGSFVTWDGQALWLGVWARHARTQPPPRLYRLDPATLQALSPDQCVNETLATAAVPLPPRAQGAAFDHDGTLWVATSDSHRGTLYRLDAHGRTQARYTLVPGLENLAFDPQGRLWSLSESGALRYARWAVRFPYVFGIDLPALQHWALPMPQQAPAPSAPGADSRPALSASPQPCPDRPASRASPGLRGSRSAECGAAPHRLREREWQMLQAQAAGQQAAPAGSTPAP